MKFLFDVGWLSEYVPKKDVYISSARESVCICHQVMENLALVSCNASSDLATILLAEVTFNFIMGYAQRRFRTFVDASPGHSGTLKWPYLARMDYVSVEKKSEAKPVEHHVRNPSFHQRLTQRPKSQIRCILHLSRWMFATVLHQIDRFISSYVKSPELLQLVAKYATPDLLRH